MADNNKVTIDAAWFAELWKIANEADEVCKDCVREKCGACKVVKERDELKAANEDLKSRVVSDTERKHFAKIEDEYIAASKERDDLKAKLERERENVKELLAQLEQERMNKCYEVTAKRLAAAERCIDDVWNCMSPQEIADNEYAHIDIIRAYREKEAK